MRRGAGERLQAWIVTGPAGHLWSATVDIAVLLARYGYRRLTGAGKRSRRAR